MHDNLKFCPPQIFHAWTSVSSSIWDGCRAARVCNHATTASIAFWWQSLELSAPHWLWFDNRLLLLANKPLHLSFTCASAHATATAQKQLATRAPLGRLLLCRRQTLGEWTCTSTIMLSLLAPSLCRRGECDARVGKKLGEVTICFQVRDLSLEVHNRGDQLFSNDWLQEQRKWSPAHIHIWFSVNAKIVAAIRISGWRPYGM